MSSGSGSGEPPPNEADLEGGAPAEASGSIDVAFSGPLPASDGTPAEVPDTGSAPVASGKALVSGETSGTVKAVASETSGRGRRLKTTTADVIGSGVEKLGTGLGNFGEGVSKLGEKSRGIPMVGAGVVMLGEGISQVGESLHELPRVAGTRRGRLLVRSLLVGFVLVAAWISVIVAMQLHGNETPDFRPLAERLLVQLNQGGSALEEVYEKASPRFQEMVRKERFIDDMNDLNATAGKFREITAVNDTLVTTGPTGRVGRVSLTVGYEKGTCKASVSLHEDQGTWKLLGVGVELPPELQITQAQREERVQACKDPMAKTCDLFQAANRILEQLRDTKADVVWDSATAVFQKQEEKSRFMNIQAEHASVLGEYRRIIAVTEARVIGGTNATFDVLTEYSRSQGVRAIFGFYRGSKANPWELRSLKVVLPMPRADEERPAPGMGSAAGSGSGPGSGSAATGSGSAGRSR